MRLARHRGLGPVATVVVVLVLSACTQGKTDDDAGDLGPFQDYLIAELGELYDLRDQVRHDRTQELIAHCMQDAGWEYVPVPWDAVRPLDSQSYEETLLERGWGIVPGNENTPLPEELERPPDPNAAIAEGLSETAQAEYYAALHGIANSDGDGLVDRQEGCYWASTVQVSEGSADERFADLFEEIRDGWAQLARDEGYQAALGRWRECMADAGYPGVQDDPMVLVEERFMSEFVKGWHDGDPRLAEMAAWEREVARTHIECRREAGTGAAGDAVIYGWEREVMERRAGDIAAYVEAVRAEVSR